MARQPREAAPAQGRAGQGRAAGVPACTVRESTHCSHSMPLTVICCSLNMAVVVLKNCGQAAPSALTPAGAGLGWQVLLQHRQRAPGSPPS